MINKIQQLQIQALNKKASPKSEASKSSTLETQDFSCAKVSADTLKAYSSISFKGKQKIDKDAIMSEAITMASKTSSTENISLSDAIKLFEKLNLSENTLASVLLASSYDLGTEEVEVNKKAVLYSMMLLCGMQSIPQSKIPGVIATSMDNYNKSFSVDKFDSLFDLKGRLRKSVSLKRPRQEHYPGAREINFAQRHKIQNAIHSEYNQTGLQDVKLSEDDIFNLSIAEEIQNLKAKLVEVKSNDETFPDALFNKINDELDNGNVDIKGIYNDYYGLLKDCKTVDEVKSLYPEIPISKTSFEPDVNPRSLRTRLANADIDKVVIEALKKIYLDFKSEYDLIIDLGNDDKTKHVSLINAGIVWGHMPAGIKQMNKAGVELLSKFKNLGKVEDNQLEFMVKKNAVKKSRIWAEYIGITNKYWHTVRAVMYRQKHPETSFYQLDKLIDGYLFALYQHHRYTDTPVEEYSKNPLADCADGSGFNSEKKKTLEKIYYSYKNNKNTKINSESFKRFKENFDIPEITKSFKKLENHYKNTFVKWFLTQERRNNFQKALEASYEMLFEKMSVANLADKITKEKAQAVINKERTDEEIVDIIEEVGSVSDEDSIKKEFTNLKKIIDHSRNAELMDLFKQYIGSDEKYVDISNYLSFKPYFDECVVDEKVEKPDKLIFVIKAKNLYLTYLFENNDADCDISFDDFCNQFTEKAKDENGVIDYKVANILLNSKSDYEKTMNEDTSSVRKEYVDIINNKFLDNTNDYVLVNSLIEMFDKIPDMFKEKYFNIAKGMTRINSETFVSILKEKYEQIVSWDIDNDEFITLDADKIPQQVVITKEAKKELFKNTNNNFERFDDLLTKFRKGATRRIGDRHGQGIKTLIQNPDFDVEIKIQGGDAVGYQRMFGREATEEDKLKYGDVKYVFCKSGPHL